MSAHVCLRVFMCRMCLPCVHLCTCTHVYMPVLCFLFMCFSVCMYTPVFLRVFLYTCPHVCLHMHLCACVFVCVSVCLHVCIMCVHCLLQAPFQPWADHIPVPSKCPVPTDRGTTSRAVWLGKNTCPSPHKGPSIDFLSGWSVAPPVTQFPTEDTSLAQPALCPQPCQPTWASDRAGFAGKGLRMPLLGFGFPGGQEFCEASYSGQTFGLASSHCTVGHHPPVRVREQQEPGFQGIGGSCLPKGHRPMGMS